MDDATMGEATMDERAARCEHGADGPGIVDGELRRRPLSLDLSRERLQRFRNVRVALERAGLTPVAVPILPTTEHFVFFSYDNVLLERRADRLHVILPVYGVEPLDRAAVDAWRRIGAHVHPVRVEGIFRYGGSIRCLVAPITRTPIAGG
jgi:hypothetical protein